MFLLKQKIYSSFLVFFLCASLFSKNRVAIISPSAKADSILDLLTVELSKDENIDLLERNEFPKILKELKLSGALASPEKILSAGKILKADIFAVIQTDEKNRQTVGLLVFDGNNGVKLWDSPLPEKNSEELARLMARRIKDSLKKSSALKNKNMKCISFLSTRNAELPKSMDKFCLGIELFLKRALLNSSHAILLERSNLAALRKEKQITGKDALTPDFLRSMLFVELEFARRPDGKTIKASARISNQNRKILFEANTAASEENPLLPAKTLLKKISDFLNIPACNVPFNAKDEARRFYQEYQTLANHGRSAEALKKIETASYLDPENKHYKMKLARALYGSGMRFIPTYRHYSFSKPEDQNLEDYKKALEMIEEAADLYLETDKRKLNNLRDFSASIRNIKNFNEYPEEIKQRTRKIHRLYVGASKSFLIKEYNISPDSKITTPKELKAYSHYVNGMTDCACYISRSEWFEKAVPLIIDWLEKANNFSMPPISWLELGPLTTFAQILKTNPSEENKKQAQKLIKAMLSHNSPGIKILGEECSILYNGNIENFSEKNWAEAAEKFIKNGKALIASGKLNDKEIARAYHLLQYGLRNFPLKKTHRELILKLYAFMESRKESFPNLADEAGYTYLSKKDYKKAYDIVQKALNAFTPNGPKLLKSSYRYPKDALLELKREILAKKPDIAGLPQYPWKNSRLLFDAGKEYLYAMSVKGKYIYAATGSPYDTTFYRVDLQNGKKTKLGTYKADKKEKIFSGPYPLGKMTPSRVSDNYFIMGSPNGIIVCPLDGSRPFKIGENNGLPSGFVQALAFFDNKIYAGLGFSGAFFASYDLNAKKIDIISSTLRKKKENLFDKFNPFRFYGIYPDPPRKRLLIFTYADISDGDISGIWSYNLRTREIKRIQRLESFPEGLISKSLNGKIMLSSYEWLLLFDPDQDKTEIVFTNDSRIYKKFLKGKKPILQWRCPGRMLEPPHLLMNEYVCFSSPFIRVSTINKKVEQMPNLSEKKDFMVKDMELLSPGKALLASRNKIWLIEF